MNWLDEYQPMDGVRLNMISTPEGEFVGATGSSRDISNSLDRSLIIRLRQLSDVFVTGGNTYRIEKYRKPSISKLAVISSSQMILPDGVIRLELENALDKLNSTGFRRILLEVGPSLAKYFLEKNLVDEFCLTIPNGSEPDAAKVCKSLGASLVLASTVKIDDTLFTRWRRGNV